ncbi:MAG: hypothetical protein H6737_26930 [Alphaproteobacteria bacterium]|nr:hypothetical protein [Alphaproteobacteria bacterium]
MSQFGAQIDDIHTRYRARFAGFPRITRDPDELEEILSEAAKLESDSSTAMDADEKARLAENRSLYERELQGIRDARAQGPAALVAHRLATWANFVQARYARYFAGQTRRTRDLGILAEMIEDSDRLVSEMEALASRANTPDLQQALETTRNNLAIYRVERDRIREDRKKVFGADRGTLFANLANDQFNRYRLHFANKGRISRSPRLLEHINDALNEIYQGMQALLDDGFNTEVHKKNMQLVKNNLDVYRDEIPKVRTMRIESPLNERVGALGGAANEVFAEYRSHFAGQNRKTRDLTLLGNLIEQLFQIGKQMDEIDRAHDNDMNAKNLGLVMDMLYLYHREHNLVQQEKAGN